MTLTFFLAAAHGEAGLGLGVDPETDDAAVLKICENEIFNACTPSYNVMSMI